MKLEFKGRVRPAKVDGASKSASRVLKLIPVILEVVQFGNLMAFGFVANQPAFYLLAVENVKKSMRSRTTTKRTKFFYKSFLPGNRAVHYLALAAGIVLVMPDK